MAYTVKEIYHSLQGEGHHAGRPAVLLRFAGCNLWTGREVDRAAAVCRFCDTDFVGTDGPGGGTFRTAEALADAAAVAWPAWEAATPFVVCTGGEPTLQLDARAVAALKRAGFEVAVETNGTRALPGGLDWVCVSPKAGAPLLVTHGDELKLVYPQTGIDPASYRDLAFTHHFLQPLDGPERDRNTELTCAYAEAHPPWKVSIQTHKVFGLP